MSVEGAQLVLDDAQRQVVDHAEGTLIFLGAPGTGTTTALAHAIAQRTRREGARSVWAVTVGRRAAADLRTQVAHLLGSGALPTITTIHALAFSLVATFGPRVGDDLAAIRVLSGAEEDQRVRDLIAGSVSESLITWPDTVREALPTLGLANEVRAFTARLREHGLDLDAVIARADEAGDPLLGALARFARMESQTAMMENVVDYSELLVLATALVNDDGVRRDLHADIRALYVDEFHDFDGVQAGLLHRIVDRQATFVVAGDPARSIYRFRGSNPRVLADLMEARKDLVTGTPPKVVIADQVHRANASTLSVAARVLQHEVIEGLPANLAATLRRPRDGEDADASAITEIITCDTAQDLYAHIGRLLRETHLRDGVPWSDMAVLTRTTATASAVRRSLESAGVPVHITAVDLALPDEPAVAALLEVLDAAAHPGRLTADRAEDLMNGPIFAADAGQTRVLARQWRAAQRDADPTRVPPRFAELQCAALNAVATGAPVAMPDSVRDLPAAQRLEQAGRVLADVAAAIAAGAPPAQVLWQVWSAALPDVRGVPWAQRLRRAAVHGHRASGHDLDAVLALFATAERLTERFHGVVGTAAFVAAIRDQRVPAEAISERGTTEREAVSVLTAHHAKARSWHTVVIVDLQEGTWPLSTPRRGLLDIDALIEQASGTTVHQVQRDHAAEAAVALDADRRLLYTALTRAHHRTVVAAVCAITEAGPQPSRFIDDLCAGEPAVPSEHLAGRPPRPLTLTGHVAMLRTRLLDADEVERAAIADELAALALLTDDDGRPLVPAADPRTWWHVYEPTANIAPLRAADEPVRLSASALQSLTNCPLRWFLDRQVYASSSRGSAAALGIAIHTLAEALATGELPADIDVLDAELDRIWPALGFDVPWFEIAERARVRQMLDRLCRFHRLRDAKRISSEVTLGGVIDLALLADIVIAGRSTTADDVCEQQADDLQAAMIEDVLAGLADIDRAISVSGRIDRIEIDDEGRLSLLDIKTTANPGTKAEVAADLQLALYQAAVLTGALAQPLPVPSTSGPPVIDHAALVVVGTEGAKGSGEPAILTQAALTEHEDPVWLFQAIADAITTIRRRAFPPRPGSHCRTCSFTSICPTQSSAVEVS